MSVQQISPPAPDSADIERRHHLSGWSGYLLAALGIALLSVMTLLTV